MPSPHQLTPSGQQPVSAWSGGTTTELAIFPPGSSYVDRSFQWRLSTANVTTFESTFTALPGFQRLLMVLSGQMTLSHHGHHQVTLAPSEQDSFSGSWVTKCQGTGRDFNLMLALGWRGRLQFIQTCGCDSDWVGAIGPAEMTAFYCVSGNARLIWPSSDEVAVSSGDFLLVQPDLENEWHLRILGREGLLTELVQASVWKER